MRKLYVDIDINSITFPFLKRVSTSPDVCKEHFYPMIDCYSKYNVTDIVFNIFCQISATKSNVFTDVLEKSRQKKENGFDVDYSESLSFAERLYSEMDVDYYKIWFDRCREKGINPWISIRMNDCHGSEEDKYLLRSDFFYKAKDNGWLIGDEYGYYKTCYNYAFEGVRNIMLEYISEQVLRYDVYGYVLDFTREMRCFKYLSDNMDNCKSIMTDFISKIRDIINMAETKFNHDIKILVRVPRDIYQCGILGLDVEKWAKFVDIIVPAPRYLSADSGIPISEWKERIHGAEICAGVDKLLSYKKNWCEASAEVITGHAAAFIADGSEGIYTYNFVLDPFNAAFLPVQYHLKSINVLSALGKENIYDNSIRFVVVNQEDEYLLGTAWKPLPFSVDKNEKNISVITGSIPKNKDVSVIIGYKNAAPNVKLNDKLLPECCEIDLKFIPGIGIQPTDYVDSETVCKKFKVDTSILEEKIQVLSFSSDCNSEICWIEIDAF